MPPAQSTSYDPSSTYGYGGYGGYGGYDYGATSSFGFPGGYNGGYAGGYQSPNYWYGN
jgi:hypothetical protein